MKMVSSLSCSSSLLSSPPLSLWALPLPPSWSWTLSPSSLVLSRSSSSGGYCPSSNGHHEVDFAGIQNEALFGLGAFNPGTLGGLFKWTCWMFNNPTSQAEQSPITTSGFVVKFSWSSSVGISICLISLQAIHGPFFFGFPDRKTTGERREPATVRPSCRMWHLDFIPKKKNMLCANGTVGFLIVASLGPQNHEKWRFYTTKIWVITPKNEGCGFPWFEHFWYLGRVTGMSFCHL